MPKYANQKHIVYHKSKINQGESFAQVKNKDWMEAAKTIPQFNTFKVYLFFAKNQEGYEDDVSPELIQEKLGMGKTSYDTAMDVLEKMRYLKKIKKGMYEFYSAPYIEEKSGLPESDANSGLQENKTCTPKSDAKVIVLQEKKSVLQENDAKSCKLESDAFSAVPDKEATEHHDIADVFDILNQLNL